MSWLLLYGAVCVKRDAHIRKLPRYSHNSIQNLYESISASYIYQLRASARLIAAYSVLRLYILMQTYTY